MLVRTVLLISATSACLVLPVQAIDISPSNQRVPKRFIDPPGKRFNLFSGDPERVQKANEVRVKDFTARITLDPPTLSIKEMKGLAHSNNDAALEVKLTVTNRGDRSYILAFPDAQRFDLLIADASGNPVYIWSDDKKFVKEIGQSFVNSKESLSYYLKPGIPLKELVRFLKPGEYLFVAVLSNYPEVKAELNITVAP